jgi:RNA polymerase sigma-70 factor (ECF subfamily)
MPRVSEAPRTPDSELVAAARAGESWAAEALYRRHRKMVQRVASRFARAHDRDDLVQDAFLKALCSLDKIENPDLFGSWIAAVVTRTAAHGFHRRRLIARLDGASALAPEHLTSRAAPPDVLAELRSIYRVLERLPVEARLVFILRRVERMSIEEVAAHLGRSVATIKRRLAHAEETLSRRMTGPRPRRRARAAGANATRDAAAKM